MRSGVANEALAVKFLLRARAARNRHFWCGVVRTTAASRTQVRSGLANGKMDLLHFRSGFLRAMLAIEETGYGTQT